MNASEKLSRFALILVVLNAVAAVVAVAANWPSQFGDVGTDAGSDVLTRGTAISAPLLPVVLLLVVIVLARRPNALGWVAIVVAYVTALMVGIGGVGEMVADETSDVSKAVLVTAGIVWLVVASTLAWLATRAAAERRAARVP